MRQRALRVSQQKIGHVLGMLGSVRWQNDITPAAFEQTFPEPDCGVLKDAFTTGSLCEFTFESFRQTLSGLQVTHEGIKKAFINHGEIMTPFQQYLDLLDALQWQIYLARSRFEKYRVVSYTYSPYGDYRCAVKYLHSLSRRAFKQEEAITRLVETLR